MQQSDTPQTSADEIVEEGSYTGSDDIHREIARGDETEGDPDERDIAGSPASIDTPQGREEAKTRVEGGTS